MHAFIRRVLGSYKHPRIRPFSDRMRWLAPKWNLDLLFTYDTVWFGPDQRVREREFAALLARFGGDPAKRCLQVGVPHGTDRKWGPNFVSLDLYDRRDCIDVSCDLADTPFADGEFDLVVCNAVLEHVTDPFRCAAEIDRITAPGGEIWIEVPFVQPYHPMKGWKREMGALVETAGMPLPGDTNHGGDYWRFTPQGIAKLFPRFAAIRVLLVDEGAVVFHGKRREEHEV